jgi:diguanylate cyclase
MLKDLFVHLCITLTFVFIGGSVFKRNANINVLRQRLLLGVLSGILGSCLMVFSIDIKSGTIIDLRYMAILLSALYGGIVSSVLTGIIICVNRFLLVSGSLGSAFTSVIMMMTISFIAPLIEKLRVSNFKKVTYMNIASLLIITVGFLFLLGTKHSTYIMLINYWVIGLFGGYLIFYFGNYISESNISYNRMKKLSTTDFITGLNNVHQFHSIYDLLIERADKKNEKLSILIIDIDHFKNVNDTYGHSSGDEVLKQMGALLLNSCGPGDIVSRNGGEEFSVLRYKSSHEECLMLGEHIRSSVEVHPFLLPDGTSLRMTISIGAATLHETTEDSKLLVKQADDALYAAKRSGRNMVC